jgi:hypothetical protein
MDEDVSNFSDALPAHPPHLDDDEELIEPSEPVAADDDEHDDEHEYDDDGDEAEAMAVVGSYATESAAMDDARTLIENGIGATVVAARVGRGGDGDDSDAAYRVEVLPIDVGRSERVLGLVESDPAYDPKNPPKLEKGPTPWKTLLIVWALAMVIVPVLAFLITWKLAGQ